MKLHIDWTACDGRGLCAELLPETLARDPWGYPLPRDGSREPALRPELEPHARRAARLCPVLALRLLPEHPRGAARTTSGPEPVGQDGTSRRTPRH
ncbi:ferredoxin [Amycolatopsis dongchuanensis]|uniref:Ferredoxin n=1 Tax=Amycolatopsis dongchuanensis TaxID=1070866 RepID=A0ABP9PRJ1_9PSEU